MRTLGGYATLGQLNQTVLLVPGVTWKTKTPFASIRRIVQQDDRFFKIRPGLWALSANRDAILVQLAVPQSPEKIALYDHTYYQGLLAEIGVFIGCKAFVPAQDKNRRYLNKTLATVASDPSDFPEFTFPHIMRRARTIDVIWFNRRGYPQKCFEVEHSTDMKNSLLKFVEMQDFATEFYIVADKVREPEFTERLRADAFVPLQNRVHFRDYEAVARMHTAAAQYALANQAFSTGEAVQ